MARSRLLTVWLPVVGWAAVIFTLSSIPSLSTGLGTWDTVLRKGAHLTEYAVLGALLYRALGREPLALAVGIAYARRRGSPSTSSTAAVPRLSTWRSAHRSPPECSSGSGALNDEGGGDQPRGARGHRTALARLAQGCPAAAFVVDVGALDHEVPALAGAAGTLRGRACAGLLPADAEVGTRYDSCAQAHANRRLHRCAGRAARVALSHLGAERHVEVRRPVERAQRVSRPSGTAPESSSPARVLALT